MSSREPSFLARPNLRGSFGACASTHWVASSVAQSVLERGGNAFDAATAGAFVLHVVEPHLNGPGGDLVALIAPRGQDPKVLCGQGPAPSAATIEHFTSEGLSSVPGSGALAAAIPGAVDAWLLLLAEHGSWELGDVLAYAIHYAETGLPILDRTAATIAAVQDLFLAHWPSSAALWLRDGRAPEPGTVVANPVYAATLARVRDEAREQAGTAAGRVKVIEAARAIWSAGFIAEAIDRFVTSDAHMHSTQTVHRGVLTREDMAGFRAHFEAPVSLDFRGHRIYKAGAWSQGPVLLQSLAILDGYSEGDLDIDTARGVHHSAEALKLALADRDAYYGEALTAAELRVLLSPAYAALRRDQISAEASAEIRPGRDPRLPDPFEPPLPLAVGPRSQAAGEPTMGPASALNGEPTLSAGSESTGEPTARQLGRGDTCHIDVIDRWGNVVSATPSGGWLQSSPTIPELGFCLGTRCQMTFLDPASPSALRPGWRPRTTLSPTIVVNDTHITALGTPGGDFQDQWQLVYLLRLLVLGYSPQAAIEAPAFHTTSFPESFWPRTWKPAGLVVETRMAAEVIGELTRRGHDVELAGDWKLGRVSSVTREHSGGWLSAAANPRAAQGYAVCR